jgi:hypothetical protein
LHSVFLNIIFIQQNHLAMKNLIKHFKHSLHCIGAGFIKSLLSLFNFWGRPIHYSQWQNKQPFNGIMKKDDWQKAFRDIQTRQSAKAA